MSADGHCRIACSGRLAKSSANANCIPLCSRGNVRSSRARRQENAEMPRSAFWRTFGLAVLLALTASTAALAQQSTQDLAEAAQNPIAAMISLPLQNNIYGEVGPNHNATGNVFNIQPVILITLGDWNIISRTIAPLIYQPSLATLPSESLEIGRFGEFSNSHFGLGDINQSFFFSPANATSLIWA